MATHYIGVSTIEPTNEEEHVLTQPIDELHVLSADVFSKDLDQLIIGEELTTPKMIEYPLQSKELGE